jgi:hypothetical protein
MAEGPSDTGDNGDTICDCEIDDWKNEEVTGEPQPDCDAGDPAEAGEETSEWKKTLLALLTLRYLGGGRSSRWTRS